MVIEHDVTSTSPIVARQNQLETSFLFLQMTQNTIVVSLLFYSNTAEYRVNFKAKITRLLLVS